MHLHWSNNETPPYACVLNNLFFVLRVVSFQFLASSFGVPRFRQRFEMSLHALLDNDEEWFNIPVVIRKVLRIMSKEQALTFAGLDEIRHDARDLREATSGWTQFVRLLESDTKQRVTKMELDVAKLSSELSDRAVSLGKQTSELAAQAGQHGDQLRQLERGSRQLKTELTESLDSQLRLVRDEVEQRARSAAHQASAHADHLNETTATKIEALHASVRALDQKTVAEMSAQGQEMQALHTRALRACNGVKDSVSSDVLSVSNRLSEAQSSFIASASELDTLKQQVDLLLQDSFQQLPLKTAALTTRIGSLEKRYDAEIPKVQERVDIVESTFTTSLDERTEHLIKRMLSQQQDTDSALEALQSSQQRAVIAHESGVQECIVAIDSIRSFLFPTTTSSSSSSSSASSSLASEVIRTSSRVVTEACNEVRHVIDAVLKTAQEQIVAASVSLRHEADTLKEQLLKTIEGVRSDVDRVRGSAAVDATQHHSRCIAIEADVANMRQTVIERLVAQVAALESQGIEQHQRHQEELAALEAAVAAERVTTAAASQHRWTEVEAHHNLRWNETERHLEEACRNVSLLEGQITAMEHRLDLERGNTARDATKQFNGDVEQLRDVLKQLHDTVEGLNERVTVTNQTVEQVRLTNHQDLVRIEGKHSASQRGASEAAESALMEALETRRQLSVLAQQLELVEENAVARVLRLSGGGGHASVTSSASSGGYAALVSGPALEERLFPLLAEQEALSRRVRAMEADVAAVVAHESEVWMGKASASASQNPPQHSHYFSPMSAQMGGISTRPGADHPVAATAEVSELLRGWSTRLQDLEDVVSRLSHSSAAAASTLRTTTTTTTNINDAHYSSHTGGGSSPIPSASMVLAGATYTKDEVDGRFESIWDSVLSLLARKEDHSAVEARMSALREEVLTEALRQSEDLVREIRTALEEKITMADLRAAMMGGGSGSHHPTSRSTSQ